MNLNNSVKLALGFGTALAVSVFAAKILLRTKRRKKITRIIDTIEEFRKHTVRIKDRETVEDKVCSLIRGGASELQVIMDFDHTITRHHLNGNICSSTYSILDQSPLIPDECRHKAKLLFEKYYPIEIDPVLTNEEKIPHVLEWYTQSHNILVNSGINKADLAKMVKLSTAMLRDGCQSLFEMLNDHKIPLLIFSAGVGDMVEEVLRHFNSLYPNMKFVSNYMDFDQEGKIKGFKGDLIHMYNKDQNTLHNTEYFKRLKAKTNIILVGDSLGDLGMSQGVQDIDTILKIGFLNSKIDDYLPKFLEGFDIVLVDDQTMEVLNGLLRRIL